MASEGRRHTAPPELAKDILGKLDNARAMLERAHAVARRAGFTDAESRLAQAEADFSRAVEEVEAAARTDIRRLLTASRAPREP